MISYFLCKYNLIIQLKINKSFTLLIKIIFIKKFKIYKIIVIIRICNIYYYKKNFQTLF